jgi:primosomal protein N' (replication factor Y)
MIAKGLDLPGVTLVGILCADIGLHLPDFRAGEHLFQLLTQVAGRAGRGAAKGRVILQTYAPEHPAVAATVKGDYEGLVAQELAFRRQHGYPPHQRLVRLLYAHFDRERCWQEAQRVADRLARARQALGLWDVSFIGPAPCYVQRLRGRYRWHLLLRGHAPQRLLQAVPLPTDWVIDVDPLLLA